MYLSNNEELEAISEENEKLSITGGIIRCYLSFSSSHCSSKESSEWREKRSHRDSRSRSPVHRKDRHKEGREEGRTRNGGYQDGRYYERLVAARNLTLFSLNFPPQKSKESVVESNSTQ